MLTVLITFVMRTCSLAPPYIISTDYTCHEKSVLITLVIKKSAKTYGHCHFFFFFDGSAFTHEFKTKKNKKNKTPDPKKVRRI